jgi:hypothetical protein
MKVEGDNVRVVSPPGGAARRLVEPVALAQPTILLANRRKTTCFAVLVHRSGDPVDFGVLTNLYRIHISCSYTLRSAGPTTDSLMRGVD